MNEGYIAYGALKSVLSNSELGSKAKKSLYKGVIVPTALYGAQACGMRIAERRKVNVLESKCLRSLVGVSRMDRFRNEEVHRRAVIQGVPQKCTLFLYYLYLQLKLRYFKSVLFHIIGNFVFHPFFFPEYLLNYECTVRS